MTANSYFKTVLIIFLLISLAGPFFVLAAEEKPINCCRLRHKIEIDGKEYGPGGSDGDVKCIGGVDSGDKCGQISSECSDSYVQASNWAMYCSLDAIMVVADLIRWFAYVATGVVFLIAGIMFFTAGGSPDKINNAKRFLFYAFIGAMIIILSNLIPSIGRFFIGA